MFQPALVSASVSPKMANRRRRMQKSAWKMLLLSCSDEESIVEIGGNAMICKSLRIVYWFLLWDMLTADYNHHLILGCCNWASFHCHLYYCLHFQIFNCSFYRSRLSLSGLNPFPASDVQQKPGQSLQETCIKIQTTTHKLTVKDRGQLHRRIFLKTAYHIKSF